MSNWKDSIAAQRALYAPVQESAPMTWADWLDRQLEVASARGGLAKRVSLTPDLARELVSRNLSNRHRSEAVVTRYARDLKEGRWAFNGESIIIASDGTLTDGQHRVHAVIAADCPMETMMVFGVAPETRTTTDQGMAKTAGNYLEMGADKLPNARLIAAAARIHLELKRYGKLVTTLANQPTKAETVAHALSRKDDFINAAHLCQTRGIVSPHVAVCALLVLCDRFGPLGLNFMQRFVGGDKEHDKCPVFGLREKLARNKKSERDRTFNQSEQLKSFFHAFCLFVTNKTANASSIKQTLEKKDRRVEKITDILDGLSESALRRKAEKLGL